MAEVVTLTVKGIGDFSDVVSNVSAVQKALTKLKLPDKLGDNLNKNISNFMKEYEKYQQKIAEGVKTQGDYNQVEKSLNKMRALYQEIGQDAAKLTQLDMKDMLNLDTGEFKKISDELTNIIKQIGSTKIDTTPFTQAFADIRKITKSSKVTGDNGILNQMIGHINTGQITEAKKQLQELQAYAKKVAPRTTADGKQAPGTLSVEKYNQLTAAINLMSAAFDKADAEMAPLIEAQNKLQAELEETKQKAARGITDEFDKYNEASKDVEKVTDSLRRMHQEEFNFNRQATDISRQIQQYFGLTQIIRKVGDIAKDAFQTVKELDKAMTETAVVTNFSVGDMWEMLPTYTKQANQLGATIKDVYEAATLYYQQGLNTNQAMALANETLKMARIAGLEAAEATDMMTAALRGFNMEINQTSAQKINDVYSELAAITASDTQEIGSAMERTASIANSANMEFETTSAFLAQMIETTREAPENLGTAMKTIVARFQEMKQDPTKLVDSEGVAMDANKVDKALKTIGISLMNTKGEFRDLDDVFLDIASRWDSLTQGQQRYIATIAAGSRQQSRFIAMMSNYERTMELVDAANNSAGASQRQFEKTLDSMEAKLNKLKNAWDQFTMGLMNNQILKFGVDALTEGFTILNKFIDILSKLGKPFGLEGLNKSLLTLVSTIGLLNFGGRGASAISGGVLGWLGGEKFSKGFSAGWERPGASKAGADAGRSGTQAGMTWSQFAAKAINSSSGEIKQAMHNAMQFSQVSGPTAIENELRVIFQQLKESSNNFGLEGHKSADRYIEAILDSIRNGQRSIRSAIEAVFAQANHEATEEEMAAIEQQIQTAAKSPVDFDKTSTNFENLTQSATKAGTAIQQFGFALQGTPLEGFGNTLIKIGQLMDSTATLAKTLGKKLGDAFNAAQKAGSGKGISTFFQTLLPTLTQLIKTYPILAAIVAIMTAIGVAAMAIAHHNKKAFEAIQNSAAAASEAYDSAKQETSELADAIEQIRTNEDAFDGLVVGTAAFNEQLVTANEQIMELIKKYPMLNDAKYLSTDKNGLMHINDEGLEAVKEYQKQRQANASALNLIQTADLNTAEAQQKAKQMRKVKSGDTTETYNQRLKEADLVEQQAKAQQDMAKINAVNTALVDKEIHNREKVSAILADQYDARKKEISLEGESIHDLKQEYADFYGYKYDKTTKKLTDVEGNEIDIDKSTVKDAIKDIRVVAGVEVDGKSLDSMINHIDNVFSKALGEDFEESGSLFSDILSDNINVEDDLVQKILTNPDKLKDAVSALSEKEIAAVLGVSADAVSEAPDKYKDELTDKLTEKATNIAETQAQSYADLAAMLAQTSNKDISKLIDENGKATTETQKANQQAIQAQLEKLTSEQKNILSSIGNTLTESAGLDTMRTFIKQATDIYTSGTKESITALDDIIKDVNWDSPTARLKAYTDMMKSKTSPAVQKLGKDLLKSQDSANLLGEAFEEFYNSNDFQDLSENMDNFVDASGKLNATSVQQMAKECKSLNNLLDTGAISAGGVAAALNALGSDGDLTLLDLNSHVLELLSTINQLDDAIASAHSSIENFDWGIDTGEAEDFAKESAKKWNELFDNGEFGNPQLEAYAKYVLGEEKYLNILKSNSGDLEATMNEVSKYVNRYADGFDNAWDDLASGSWKGKDLSETLKDKGISVYEEGGDIIWDPGTATTNELIQWLQEVEGISEDMAKVMLEDWENYSPDFRNERTKNDFEAGLVNGNYIGDRINEATGQLTITASEIKTIADATGRSEDEIKSALIDKAGIDESQLNVLNNIDKNGQMLVESDKLSEEYNKSKTGGQEGASWISDYKAFNSQGVEITGGVELKNAIAGAVEDGLSHDQAMYAAWTEAQKLQQEGGKMLYDGVELFSNDLTDFATFSEKINEITENSQWIQVGEAIASGYINYLKGVEDPNNTNNNTNQNDYYSNSKKENGGSGIGTDWLSNDPATDPKDAARAKAKENWSQLWSSIKEAFTSGTPAEDPKDAARAKAQENWSQTWQSIKEAFTTDQGIEDPKTVARQNAEKRWQDLWAGIKQAFTSTPTVESTPKPQPQQQAAPQTQETTLTVHTEDSELDATKAKIDTVIQAASQPQTLNIITNTGASTDTALNNINKIKEATKGNNTINVSAKVKGKEDVNNLNSVITNIKPKTINVTANVSGASKVTSLKNEINNLKNKDIYITTHKKTVNDSGGTAKGIHNRVSYRSIPSLGSMAGGGRYGRLGPKGRGGLTLTGEEGFEIAWLPSESRSMILGAEGPQMINLPADAVVYTHEQSEDILKKRQEIEAGSHSKRKKKKKTQSSGSKSKKKSKKKSKGSSKDTKETINNFSMQEVVRFNIDQKLTKLTDEIAKKSKEIEKSLGKIGTTYKDIAKTTQSQVSSLEGIKNYNQQLYNSYAAQLADYRSRQAIVSYTDSKGESQEKKINIASYLNADGSANTAAIQAAGGRAVQEAIYKEISSAKTLVDGMNNAKKAMDDAQQQIDDLGQKISEAFYQWENELTEVYDLTQRINNEVSFTNRFTSQIELELSKLGAGFGDTAKAIENTRSVLIRNNQTIKDQIANQQQMIAARQRELNAALSYQDEIDKRKKFEQKTDWGSSAEKNATIEWAKELEKAAMLGSQYVKNVFKDIDGSIQYEIDWEKFNSDNEVNPYSKDTYESIKKYLNDLNNAATEFNNSIKDQTDFIKETYDALREYQDYIADMEDTLIKGVEEQIEEAKNNAKQLSDSITSALKDLLDEVKRKLDERRKQEDNLKTERDISQKQQRLAALRADTAGGHQVEIAQLEKEIADSQQSYQRTLEDQLLDRLQQQGDQAAEQRERQIALMEANNQIDASTNKEVVDSWLREPEKFKEQIREAWLEAQGYADKGAAGQYVLENQFESDFAQLVTAVEESNFKDSFNALTADTNSLTALLNELTNGQLGREDELANSTNALLDVTDRNTTSILTEMQKQNSAAFMKAKGVGADTLKTLGYTAKDLIGDDLSQPIYDLTELQKAGYKASELREAGVNDVGHFKGAGYSVADLKDADFTFADLISHYTPEDLKNAAYGIADFANNNIDYNTAKALFGVNALATSGTSYSDQANKEIEAARLAAEEAERKRQAAAAAEAARQARVNAYNAAISAAHSKKTVNKSTLVDAINKGAAAGVSVSRVGYDLASGDGGGGVTWEEVVKAAKKAGYSKATVKSWWNGYGGYATKAINKWSKFATGGLADYTGPAWLDGTPSKPELVLNSTDTKNFLMLKDVLSSAMKSTSSVNNSYGGDTTYEININVDHLNSDYDVDRVAERVKKIIVKDSSYRNVTQVRNLR